MWLCDDEFLVKLDKKELKVQKTNKLTMKGTHNNKDSLWIMLETKSSVLNNFRLPKTDLITCKDAAKIQPHNLSAPKYSQSIKPTFNKLFHKMEELAHDIILHAAWKLPTKGVGSW